MAFLATTQHQLMAQGGPADPAETQPTSPPVESASSQTTISPERLQVKLRPLTRAELEAELKIWLGNLTVKIREVGALELSLIEAGENEGDQPEFEDLRGQLIDLKVEEKTVIEQTTIVV